MAGWSVGTDAQRGRHLLATQRFGAGQQIVSQQQYAAVLYDDQQPLVCDHSMKPAANLKRCGGCKLVW